MFFLASQLHCVCHIEHVSFSAAAESIGAAGGACVSSSVKCPFGGDDGGEKYPGFQL